MRKVLLGLLALIMPVVLTCCQDEVISEPEVTQALTETINNYLITPEEAVGSLLNYVNGGGMSRAGDSLNVESVLSINMEYPYSRSSAEASTTLAYAVNFNHGGYSLVAADSRVGASVLSIVEQGCITDSLVRDAVTLLRSPNMPRYPQGGSMYLTFEEYPDEVFFNPNASSYYDEEVKDEIVGNFSDVDDPETTGGKAVAVRTDIANLVPLALCIQFAINEVTQTGKVIPDGPLVIKPVDNLNTEVADGGWTPWVPDSTEWEIVSEVSPILAEYRDWRQQAPFNDLYPKRKKCFFFGNSRRAPAGCFPLAIAKIMKHFNYPSKVRGNYIEWASLNCYDKESMSFANERGNQNARILLKSIADGCNSLYFYSGTFTFPFSATSFLRDSGFLGAHSKPYSFDRVTEMLDNNRPLIAYALPGINILKSHVWNIDGYKTKRRTITEYTMVDGKNVVSSTRTETSNMVHCDFGWEGKSNGYYESGVFSTSNEENEYDQGDQSDNGKFNYNTYLHLVTYGNLR